MARLCVTLLSALLLALYFSTQVVYGQKNATTPPPTNNTADSITETAIVLPLLLLPLTLAAFFIPDWSQ